MEPSYREVEYSTKIQMASYTNGPIWENPTLEDVVRCMAAKNVWWVERKPTAKDSAETIELTKSAKQHIAHRFEMVISKVDSVKLKRLKESAKVFVEILREFS